jgi:trigger factor
VSISKETISDQNLMLNIELSKDDYMPVVNKAIKDYSKKVNLKGFRVGKVPFGIVKKMYGKEILAEELQKMLSQQLSDFIKDNELSIIGDPLPNMDNKQDIDITDEKTYQFSYELGLQPEIDLDYLEKKPSIVKHVIDIDDALLDDEIKQMQKRFGKMTNPESIESDEDTLYVELTELDEDGNEKQDGLKNTLAIPFTDFKGKKLIDQIKKMKKDESMPIDLFKSFDKERKGILHDYFNLHDFEIDVNPRFLLTLKNINHTVDAEVNQELFDKVYGEGNVKSEEEFRDKIKGELGIMLDNYSVQRLNNDIVKDVIEKIEMTFPEDFLKRWMKFTSESEITEEQIEEDFEPFLRNLRWTLTVNKIMKEQNIEVTKDDIEKRTGELIKMEYGISTDDEQYAPYVNDMIQKFMQNEEHVNKVFDNLRDQKVFAYLQTLYNIKEKSISFDAFKNLK